MVNSTHGIVYLWEEYATVSVVTGTKHVASFTIGNLHIYSYVFISCSDVLSDDFTVNLADNTDATDFVTLVLVGITYTDALVTKMVQFN